MSTLEVHGIKWAARRHNAKLALSFRSFAIFFNTETNRFEAWSLGYMVCFSKYISECIEPTTHAVLDSIAESIVPYWQGEAEHDPFEITFEEAA